MLSSKMKLTLLPFMSPTRLLKPGLKVHLATGTITTMTAREQPTMMEAGIIDSPRSVKMCIPISVVC